MNEILPYIGIITALITAVTGYAMLKAKVKELDERRKEDMENHKDQLAAVRIAKTSRHKEMKEDYNEKIQVAHARIDKLRESVDAQKDKVEEKLDRLGEKIDNNQREILETVTRLITKK